MRPNVSADRRSGPIKVCRGASASLGSQFAFPRPQSGARNPSSWQAGQLAAELALEANANQIKIEAYGSPACQSNSPSGHVEN